MIPSPEFFMGMRNEPIPDRQFQSWAWINPKGAAQEWGNIVETPVELTLEDLTSQPMVFVTGITPNTLEPQLERSHLGRPLMHVGVGSAKDFSRFEQICPTIIDGRITHAETMKTIRGTVMVTDPSGVLNEAIQADLPDSRWEEPWRTTKPCLDCLYSGPGWHGYFSHRGVQVEPSARPLG